jgi:hypothetical protein
VQLPSGQPQGHLKSWLASLIDLILIYQASKCPTPSKAEEKNSENIN